MTKYFRLAAAIIVALTFVAPVAAADEPSEVESPDAEQQAAEAYSEASEAYAAGQFDRAAELLDLAFDYDPDLIYRYNQLLAYLGMADYEAGIALLDEYQEVMEKDARFDDIGELREEFEEAIAEREPRDEAREEQQLEEPAAISTPPTTTDEDEDSGNILGWTMVGSGSALLAGGLVVGSGVLIGDQIDRIEGSRTAESQQQIYGGESIDRQDDLDTLRTHRILSAVLLSVGAVASATGGLLLWRSSSSTDDTTSSLRLDPMLDDDRRGAVLHGRF